MVFCIIGGNGFIGHALVKRLMERGIPSKDIIIVDVVKSNINNDVKFIESNYKDAEKMKMVLPKIDYIIHLAYSTVPKTSFDNPVSDIIENLSSLVNFLELVKNYKNIKSINLVSSGGTVYGNANSSIAEEFDKKPISPYGITKLASEKYCYMYYKLSGVPIVISRPSNAYGKGQRFNAGQGFITSAIYNILNKKEVEIFGEKGTIRDYIYINDLVEAIINVSMFGKLGEAYNIGTGLGYSNYEILKVISAVKAVKEGYEIKVKKLPERSFDVQYNVLNIEKIKRQMKWEPTIDINQGIKLTWDYVKCEISK